jgi:Mg2+ and Co2+ transporter CorA
MKKLSMNEMNVLSNEISRKINEVKYEKIKGKLEKDNDYKKLEKLSKEVDELSKKLEEKRKVYNEIVSKIRSKYDINNVYRDSNNEIKIMFSGLNVYNDLVLYSIGRELNVEEMINKIVEKYS